jgi:hypothetical protein
MKYSRFSIIPLLTAFYLIFFIGASCTDTAVQEDIGFMVDGQTVVFNKGLTASDDKPFAVYETDGGSTYIYAGMESVSDTSNLPDDYLMIRIFANETGSWQVQAAFMTVWYYRDGVRYWSYQTGNVSVTITQYGEVGEDVEGSFHATVSDGDGTSFEITDGYFKVTRLPDDSVASLPTA